MSSKGFYSLAKLLEAPLPPWSKAVRDPVRRQLKNELRVINLKSVKRLHFQFDPFHDNVSSIRQFLVAVSVPKIRATNPKCTLKTDILCKREEPTITAQLESGQKLIFKTSLLSTLEIAENYNQILRRLNRSVDDLAKK